MFWLRLIGGGAAGLVLASVVYFLVEWITHGWFDEEGVFITMLVGYTLGGVIGGALAAKIGGTNAANALAGLLTFLAATNIFVFGFPWWFLPCAIILIFGGCFLGSRFVSHPEY